MNYINLWPTPDTRDEVKQLYRLAKGYNSRCRLIVNINTFSNVSEHGYAYMCSIGPRGGKYVHIITDGLRVVKRSFSSVSFHNFNIEEPFVLRG